MVLEGDVGRTNLLGQLTGNFTIKSCQQLSWHPLRASCLRTVRYFLNMTKVNYSIEVVQSNQQLCNYNWKLEVFLINADTQRAFNHTRNHHLRPIWAGKMNRCRKSLWMWNTNGKSLLTSNICLLVWVDGARRSGQTFIISHLSATFRAVWRKRAWSFSFRLCSACVMRALERSRHWRQLAICCANLRSFITCKRRSTGQKVNPSAGFSSVCSFALIS